VAAATSRTDGQAPITSPSTWERANASSPAAVSWIVIRRPSRRVQTAMQARPQAASTTPPSGREPVATATPKPATSPVAAIGAVISRSASSDEMSSPAAIAR
jgi:hypothetical protein